MEIIKLNKQNKHILTNLMQAYEAEFSAITRKLPDANGLFPFDTPVDDTDVNYHAYLLYVEGSPCGFAMKGTASGRHDIAEFYVVPSKRGSDLGTRFAHEIFDMYKGPWQVRQIAGADKARDFWRKAIGTYSSGKYEESQDRDPYWGMVTRQIFESRRT